MSGRKNAISMRNFRNPWDATRRIGSELPLRASVLIDRRIQPPRTNRTEVGKAEVAYRRRSST